MHPTLGAAFRACAHPKQFFTGKCTRFNTLTTCLNWTILSVVHVDETGSISPSTTEAEYSSPQNPPIIDPA